MRPECIREVETAIGRTLGKGESQRIQDSLTANLKELERTDPKFGEMSQSDRLLAAAKLSLEQDMAAAARAAKRKALNVASQAREAAHLPTRAAEFGGKNPHHKALFERLVQVENYKVGVHTELMSEIVDVMKAASPEFFGLIENTQARNAFVREVLGEDSGNPQMKAAAKTWLDAVEKMRLRENAAGADIGKLDYGYLPSIHSVGRIIKAGKDAWVGKILPLLRRDRYVNSDGTRMNDTQVRDLLNHAYDTLSTEGAIRREPGTGAQGSRASRFDDKHRVLHFKDAESYLKYADEFGEGTVFESMNNHVMAHAKNIGLMEAFGPNPNATYRMLKDIAESEDARLAGRAVQGVRKFGATADMVWDVVNGANAVPVDPSLAAKGQAVRNYITAAKLQGVMLSSINDAATWMAVAKYNGVPLGKALSDFMGAVSGKNVAEDAARLGLAVESMSSEMAAWNHSNLAQGWTGKLANATMRLGLVESWTQRLRAGLGLMLSDQLATLTKTDWAALSEFDRARLKAAGVTDRDWTVWQQAKPENVRGRDLLTKNGVRAVDGAPAEINHAVAALLGFIDAESKSAVLAPDVITRATITQGSKAGTIGGEIGRSLMLFKSFPLAMVSRHLDRIRMIPTAQGKAAYSIALMTSLTLMGALSVQLKDLVQGKNPRDMTNAKFWGASFAQGGGLGIYGDLLYTGFGGNSRGGQPNWANLAGPVVGVGLDAINVTAGNIGQAARGEKTNFAGEAIRFTRQNLPFLNLWYLKSAIDHAGMNDLQESLSPGYLARQRAAAKREWGSSYWWQPTEGLPNQAPDLAQAVGE